MNVRNTHTTSVKNLQYLRPDCGQIIEKPPAHDKKEFFHLSMSGFFAESFSDGEHLMKDEIEHADR